MDSVTIDIRPAEPTDSFQISQTHQESWAYAYNGLLPYRALRDMFERRDLDWWKRAIAGSANIMVLDVGGDVAGYATMGVNRVEELSQQGEIYELYLRPEFMGVGLGQRLFSESRRFLNALNYRGCLIWCLADNEGAINFYRAMGGRQVARGHEKFDGARLPKVAFAWS